MKCKLLLLLLVLFPATLPAQSAPEIDKPFVVEYYYKTKWGHADEFLQLFKKNHYPLLRKEVEMGRMLKVWVDQPRYHTTEDGRWDYRVTHRLQEFHRRQRTLRRGRDQETALARSGHLSERGAAPLRNP